jgi:peptidoglycan/xylan/chitin deacetylase (PgdA/CDA1 family)
MGFLAITVDLDEIDCYHAIHGLAAPDPGGASIIYERALPRIAQYLEELRVGGTFFVVGRDLEKDGKVKGGLKELSNAGHEIANHSMNHFYDLTMRSQREAELELDGAADAIERAIGKRPVGFRAPGYNIHTGLTETLKNRNYLYDSSVFPCPIYYSAKTVAIGMKSIRGMHSASLLGDPRVLGAPVTPYRIGDGGVWTRGNGLAEIPITVVTSARLPFIGTALSMMGTIPATILSRTAARLPVVNLEFHGIDFADADGDGIGHLKQVQPDLNIPLCKRIKTFRKVVRTLLDRGLEPVTLEQLAKRIFI